MAQKVIEKKLQKFEPGSEEMESYLATAYGMDKEQAEDILNAYKANPLSVTPQDRKDARAFLAALNTRPKAISTKPAYWKVQQER
ncbi:MAG TPA: hypothetical protein VMW34_12140 [Anaerolineales bacterium]|nr:hypothetical protein [Anaerolineales bacterium]